MQKRKRLLCELGRALRENDRVQVAQELTNEIFHARVIAKRVTVLQEEIAQLSAGNFRWFHPKRMAFVCIGLIAIVGLIFAFRSIVGFTSGPADIAASKKFLDEYHHLREAPQLRLRSYADRSVLEWRCYIQRTSETGLPWVFGQLPSTKLDELELMIHTADPNEPNRIWPIILKRKNRGLDPKLEATVQARVTHFYAHGANSNVPRIDLVGAIITEVDPSASLATPAGKSQPDVLAANQFLSDWRNADPKDPEGSLWLSQQLQLAGYPTWNCRIRWRCVANEVNDDGALRGTLYGATDVDPSLRISLKDKSAANRLLTDGLPIEITLEGDYTGFIAMRTVEIQNASVVIAKSN